MMEDLTTMNYLFIGVAFIGGLILGRSPILGASLIVIAVLGNGLPL